MVAGNHHLNFNTHSDSSDHCCVCHTVPMGATQPQMDSTPGAYMVYEIPVPTQALIVCDLISSESPRGPPAA